MINSLMSATYATWCYGSLEDNAVRRPLSFSQNFRAKFILMIVMLTLVSTIMQQGTLLTFSIVKAH